MSEETSLQVEEINQDSKNLALLCWIGTIFFGFIPGLILYLVKTDDNYVREQAKEALNWSITSTIAYLISFILTFILIGALFMFALGICHLVFCIMGAVATAKGDTFKVPYTLRLIK
ncbi:DUF4870 domain-containing protein [Shewanella sp. KT0246]|uniref:DUF4870 domain-containing protein n=1 Tax=Shewanella sp. KT0246 TaxID=2815912 RepID=UPI001BC7A8B4|nr:DUF4870 domain-containing protein [Shewanella sp. KT0246]GIU49472.1 membrane protein [Shewanella sp. KT0246]